MRPAAYAPAIAPVRPHGSRPSAKPASKPSSARDRPIRRVVTASPTTTPAARSRTSPSRRLQPAAMRKYRTFAASVANKANRPRAGIRHRQGWLPSARPHSIVRRTAKAFSCGILYDA